MTDLALALEVKPWPMKFTCLCGLLTLSLVCRRTTLTSPGNRSWSNLFALTMVTLQMCSTSLGPRYGITTGGVICLCTRKTYILFNAHVHHV